MYAESEVDNKTRFVPNTEELWQYPRKICHRCKNYENCPLWYECEDLKSWLDADLDDDDTDD